MSYISAKKMSLVVILLLASIFSFEVYQNIFSDERKYAKEFLLKNDEVKKYLGNIEKIYPIGSGYSNDSWYLKYYLIGSDNTTKVKLYYEATERKNEIEVKKIYMNLNDNYKIIRITK